jgi:linker histone H1 and H5 family
MLNKLFERGNSEQLSNNSSHQAIVKYLMANYKVGTDQKTIDSSVKDALKNSIEKGRLKTTHNVDYKKAT